MSVRDYYESELDESALGARLGQSLGGGRRKGSPEAAPGGKPLGSGPGRGAGSHMDDEQGRRLADDDGHHDIEHQALADDRTLGVAVDFALTLAQGRNQRIAKVAEDSVLIHSMIGELAYLVDAQTETLGTIEENISKTRSNVMDSHSAIVSSNDMTRQSRQRLCCIMLGLAVAVVVVVLFLTLMGNANAKPSPTNR